MNLTPPIPAIVILLLFLSWSPIRGHMKDEAKLVIPARKSCNEKSAFIDFAVKRCVSIDRWKRRMPTFAPCLDSTTLEGRHCVGLTKTDFELGCPHQYLLNNDGACVRGEAYRPPRIVCPPDYKLTRGRIGEERTCNKRVFAEPIYESTERSNIEIHCPESFRLLRKGTSGDGGDNDAEDYLEEPRQLQPFQKRQKRTRNRTSGEAASDRKKSFRKVMERKRAPLCISDNIVLPSSKETCSTHFYWSAKVSGCLMLEARDPKLQCPRPDARVGVGRGDWNTPEFVYDPASNQCIASSSPALYPRCPPGWALEGLFKPYCYKKLYSPIVYDCDNAEGFKFIWDENLQIGLCIFEFDKTAFAAGPSHLTRRSRTNSAILKVGETPWDVLQGFAAGINFKELAQQTTEQAGLDYEEGRMVTRAEAASNQLAFDTLVQEDMLPIDPSPLIGPFQSGEVEGTLSNSIVAPNPPIAASSNKPGPLGVTQPNYRNPFGGRIPFGTFSVHRTLF